MREAYGLDDTYACEAYFAHAGGAVKSRSLKSRRSPNAALLPKSTDGNVRVMDRTHALEVENQSLRDALFAILRSQGRIRVSKEHANAIQPGDGMGVRDVGDAWVFEYQPSNMVVPGGVKGGNGNDAA